MSLYDVYGNQIDVGNSYHNHNFATLFPNLVESGYSFSSDKVGECNSVKLLDFNAASLQSVGYDYENGHFYKFADNTTVLKFNEKLQQLATITLPSTAGHCNDACYYSGKFYLAEVDKTKDILYEWNIQSNTVRAITLNGISNPSNGSVRYLAGVCEAERGTGKLYLVTQDRYGTSDIDHQDGDKMAVYLYDIANNTTSLIAEYDWDCVYVQGCTCVNGILYVACNTATTGAANNYKGITIKVFDTLGWQMIDEMSCAGNFEPEGMDFIQNGTENYLSVGIGHYGTIAIDVLFRAPY